MSNSPNTKWTAMQTGLFYSEGKLYSDEARNLICCCALYTTYSYEDVASLFRGELYFSLDPHNPAIAKDENLRNVQGYEVRDCFFHMYDTRDELGRHSDRIFTPWYRLLHSNDLDPIDRTVAPLHNTGRTVRYQNRPQNPYHCYPVWKRR
ncbi:hypothetical protein MMC07_002775 [Pseudocyphellaria aurata]|nr:hypothetical protein [Pseudocyphellaria aurata]